jgi:hypothetical protein
MLHVRNTCNMLHARNMCAMPEMSVSAAVRGLTFEEVSRPMDGRPEVPVRIRLGRN